MVAVALLPLFEAEPEHWAAVQHLNDVPPGPPLTLAEYLARWHDHADEADRAFVRKIAREFGVELKGRG